MSFAAAALMATTMAALPASATTIDFDNLPGGGNLGVNTSTALTNQYASLGVTFSASFGGTAGDPTATNYSGGPANNAYSVNYLTNHAVPTSYGNTLLAQRYDLLSINFSTAVNNVSFGLNTFFTQGFATFKAYDTGGALLQNIILSANGGWEIRSLSASNIARIDITPTTINGSTIAIFGIDNLSFTPVASAAVPEPASWALMIAGFGLVGGAMRRRNPPRTTVSFA